MAETINIGEIANRLSKDIFRHFLWETHAKHDDNFPCVNPDHKTDTKPKAKSKPDEGDDKDEDGEGKSKATHPGDVVFSYGDPYLDKTIYLHTDLKSYAKGTLKAGKLRTAFKSLCMTVECANYSDEWRRKYSVLDSEPHEVRGLLFIHNHDNKYMGDFGATIKKVSLSNLPLATGTYLHYLGPYDIQRLYSIGNDIIRLKDEGVLPTDYTFYYPDLVMNRRRGDGTKQAATIEALTGSYLILKHPACENCGQGFVIYYNRSGDSVDELVYFLDCLSRYQMLESHLKIRIRVTAETVDDLKSVFDTAKKKYAKVWGFDDARTAILDTIEIDRITAVTSTYNPGDMGWRV